jgi:site-specific DNA recombinase
MKEIKYAIGYCRVSTKEQADNGMSIGVQVGICEKAIKDSEYELLEDIIKDEGRSGGTLKRPGIQKVIELVQSKKVDAVFAYDSSRLSRSVRDHLDLMEMFALNGVKVVYTNGLNSDGSPEFEMMDLTMAGFNQYHRKNTSKKVKETLYPKAKAGYYPDYPPVGYKNIENPNYTNEKLDKRIIIVDEVMGPLVTEMFKLYATGNFNGYDLGDIMYHKGLRTRKGQQISPSRFYAMLRNRFYLGEFKWGPVHCKKAKHQPLIDRATFDAVQMVLDGHNNHACRRRKYSFLLNGFLYCYKHNKRFTAEWHLKKTKAYYHCTQRGGCGKNIEINKMEGDIAIKFQELQFSNDFIELVIEKANAIYYGRKQEYNGKRQGLINQRAAFEARRKVARNKLLTGVISDNDYKKVDEETTTEIMSIDNKIGELGAQKEARIDIASEIMRMSKDIYQTYMEASQVLKRLYLGLFWKRFEIADGIIMRSEPTLLFTELLKLQKLTLQPRTNNLLKGVNTATNHDAVLSLLSDTDYVVDLHNKLTYIKELERQETLKVEDMT